MIFATAEVVGTENKNGRITVVIRPFFLVVKLQSSGCVFTILSHNWWKQA